MKVYGITGGIGSGKSYVADILAERFDLLHIDTDAIAKRQMCRGGASYDSVVREFGEKILGPDGEIDRGLLGSVVFADSAALSLLNSITHPNVTATVKALITSCEDMYDGVLVETAILKEAGYEDFCDEIIFVSAPKEDRINRLTTVRGISEERALATMGSQADDESFMDYATMIIDNPDGTTGDMIASQFEEKRRKQ